MLRRAYKHGPIVLGAFAFGAVATLLFQMISSNLDPCHQRYDLINPVRRCGDRVLQSEWDYEPLREALLTKNKELTVAGDLTQLSVYFRDLDHGPRFGIGEYEKFHPASLTKLPVLIAFLHAADLDPLMLDETISFTGNLNVNENTEASTETIKPDTPYTILELLRKMIIYSDNYSYALLTREMNASPSIIAYYTFRDLGVLRMMLAPNADYISIRTYGDLYAVLYNTGYLSREMSQMALQMLSEATYDAGLKAGVPPGIRVAHKFGHRILENEQQLHDCGIVYHPEMAYILCIMTSGHDEQVQARAIGELSNIVFNAVSEIHVNHRGE